MGSLLGVLPSFDPFNFNQLRPSDPSNPCKLMLVTYHSSHSQTPPPPDQVIVKLIIVKIYLNSPNSTNIALKLIKHCLQNLLTRNFYQHDEEKLRPKRAATEHLIPEHGCKQAKASTT
ncbi:hypothetical protein V6Z11_D12G262000 [Gossypium hirsutum]